MSLTASDLASLSTWLRVWEISEYVFAGLVTVACFGEYVADFTNWFTSGDEEKKKRLAKRSTLVLVGSLALELVCLVRTNQLSGEMIGALDEKAGHAEKTAQAAETSASNALAFAKDAREEANAFQQQISSARTDLAGFRKEASARRLTEEQKRTLRQVLEKLPGAPIAVGRNPVDNEAKDLADDFIAVLKEVHWQPVSVMQVPLSIYGVVLGIAEKEGTNTAEYRLLKSALTAAGFPPHEVLLTVGEGAVSPPVQTHVLYLLIGPHPPVNVTTKGK